MAASSDIRKPSVIVQFEGGTFEAQSMVYNAQVGTVPTMSAVLHPVKSKNSVVEVKASDFAEQMAAQQAKFYTSRSPDFTADIDDGAGGKLNFKGFSSAVSCALSVRSVGINISAVHAAKVLSSLSLSMYNTDLSYAVDEGPKTPPVGTSVAERLGVTTEKIISDWSRNLKLQGAAFTDAQLKTFAELHQANAAPKAVWDKVLAASKDTTVYENFAELKEPTDPVNIQVFQDMKSRLRSPSEDFFGVIAGIGESYQILYIPPTDGDGSGKLVKLGDLRTQAKGASLDETGITLSCGNPDLTPPTHILVEHTIRPVNANKAPKDANGNIIKSAVPIMVFPDSPFDGAMVITATAPPWLPVSIPNQRKTEEEMKKYAGAKVEYDPKIYLQNIADKLVLTKRLVGSAEKLLMEWMKQYYIDMALASSTADITIPLDLSWQPGTWYDVKSKSGGVLFSGLLAAVTHRMAVASGGQVEATTALSFTHGEFGSFKLPGV